MRRFPVSVLCLLVLLLGLLSAPAQGAQHTEAGQRPLVLIGAPGLTWDDISPLSTPALWARLDEAAIGVMTVRSVRARACAADGWLTLGAGRRAADSPSETGCRPLELAVDGRLARWPGYLEAAATDGFDAQLGLLAGVATAAGTCLTADGAGAQRAAADARGLLASSAAQCPVHLVDAGVLPTAIPDRAAALSRLDAQFARWSAAADVIVAGIGDGDSARRPRAVVVLDAALGPGQLTSNSTRQRGLIQLPDLSATLAVRLGGQPTGTTGAPVRAEVDTAPLDERVADLLGLDQRASTMLGLAPLLSGLLAGAFLLWALLGVVLGVRGENRGARRVLGLVVAAFPAATLAANLLPWWRSTHPAALATVVMIALAGALAAAARWAARAHPEQPLAAGVVLWGATFVVLAGDVLAGSRLQLSSPFGYNPIVGGRFYGFGNATFAAYGVATLGLVAAVMGLDKVARRTRSVLAGLLLVLALAIEAAPSLGADFGGPPALALGGILLLAWASGVRVHPRHVVAVAASVTALAALIMWLDWRQAPEDRTHLGNFLQSVLDGEVGDILGRKVAQNLANLISPPLLILTGSGVLAGVVGLRRCPHPLVAQLAGGAAVMAAVAFVLNDSGLVIPAFAAATLVPAFAAHDDQSGPRRDDQDRQSGP